MKLNPNDLLIFLTITETRSITEAATRSGLTKSAISQALKRLEDAIEAKLLFRTTRSLSLTEAGMRLLPMCRKMREAQQEIDATIADLTDKSASLTVTAPHALCQPLLIPLLAQVTDTDIRVIADDAALNLVDHQIDLAIRVGAPAPQSAQITRIGTLNESLWASDALVQYMGGVPGDLQELSGWPHAANDWQGSPLRYLLENGGVLTAHPRFRCNTVHGLQEFIAQGSAVGLLPDILAQTDPRLTPLVPISQSPVYALHQHGKTPPPGLRDLIQALRSRLKKI